MASFWSNSVPRSNKLDEGLNLLKLVTLDSFHFIMLKIKSKEAFTDRDIEKLAEKLKLNDVKIKQIIESVSYLHKKLSKVVLRPAEVEKALIENFDIDEDKAHLWIQIWAEDISQNFNLENMSELQNITWELNLETASTLFRKEVIPTATLQLKGSNNDTVLRLDEEELAYLYSTLENIQAQLDM